MNLRQSTSEPETRITSAPLAHLLERLRATSEPNAALEIADETLEDACTQMEKGHERRQLGEAISQLPEPERTIVQMHYFQGARFKEIGALLGVSEPRVSQLHTRAMGQLKKILGDDHLAAAA